jgi:hypothetical protein
MPVEDCNHRALREPTVMGLSIDLFAYRWTYLMLSLISFVPGYCSPPSMIITCNRAPAPRQLIPSEQPVAQAHSR